MKVLLDKVWGDNQPTRFIIWITPETVDEVLALVSKVGEPLKLERRGEQFAIDVIDGKAS